MSYVLYSSIARAGGIDLLLSLESFTHEPTHPLRRQSPGYGRLARLRRRSGRTLIGLGDALSRWGRRWARPLGTPAHGRVLKLVAE
jgi:hypothetical protein